MTGCELPPRLSGQSAQDLAALRDYLVRLVDTLPDAGDTGLIDRAVKEAVSASAGAAEKTAAISARSQAQAVKQLIIKTADEIYESIDRLETSLSATYLARSDFGDYTESVDTTIVQTARETVESYDYDARIEAVGGSVGDLAEALTRIDGELRRGLITDPETGEEALGIAISQSLSFTGATRTEDGLTYYELSPGQTLGLYTSTGWQFWIGGSKRGWFDSTDGMLHVAQIAVESRLQLGADWVITTAGGFGIRYTGG